MATVALRPVAVWLPGDYQRVEDLRRQVPASEWEPFWEFGAFVDVRDVAAAVEAAVNEPLQGHHRALLCADDISGSAPSLELAGRLAPQVPVRDPARYADEPQSALVDCWVAQRVLGWRAQYRWSERGRHD